MELKTLALFLRFYYNTSHGIFPKLFYKMVCADSDNALIQMCTSARHIPAILLQCIKVPKVLYANRTSFRVKP